MPHTLLELGEQTWNEVVSAFRKAGLAHVFIERDDLIILDEMGMFALPRGKHHKKVKTRLCSCRIQRNKRRGHSGAFPQNGTGKQANRDTPQSAMPLANTL